MKAQQIIDHLLGESWWPEDGSGADVNAFIAGFIDYALRTTQIYPEDEDNVGRMPTLYASGFGTDELVPGNYAKVEETCALFYALNSDALSIDPTEAGQNFWLTLSGGAPGFAENEKWSSRDLDVVANAFGPADASADEGDEEWTISINKKDIKTILGTVAAYYLEKAKNRDNDPLRKFLKTVENRLKLDPVQVLGQEFMNEVTAYLI